MHDEVYGMCMKMYIDMRMSMYACMHTYERRFWSVMWWSTRISTHVSTRTSIHVSTRISVHISIHMSIYT